MAKIAQVEPNTSYRVTPENVIRGIRLYISCSRIKSTSHETFDDQS